MNEKELTEKLLSDLKYLNLPVDEVDLFLRPFSETLYGRYFPVRDEKRVRPKLYLYPYATKDGEFLMYDVILETAIHELCHHIQYMDNSFIRNKGVMHNSQFWMLYNHYIERAKRYKLIRGEVYENIKQKS